MSNREHLNIATLSVGSILADVKEKVSMHDAGRVALRRSDDFAECQTILEEITKHLDRLDYLL